MGKYSNQPNGLAGFREGEAPSEPDHAAARPPRIVQKYLNEILESVRREFDESGMSEEELVRFLTGVRDDVRREKAARPC